jgi:signal transduction histidine kinase
VIEVTDTGVGIPPEDHDRLFDRLYRASSATEGHVPGTGLGLTIVKAIVEAHGGVVSVESQEHQGSTFRIELPIQPLGSQETNGAAANAAPAGQEVQT